MYFFVENNRLSCGYKGNVLTNLSVMLEYRGEHYDMLELKSKDWEISQNGCVAKSRIGDFGVMELRAIKASGGLIFRPAFHASAHFTARKCYRFGVGGFLPCRAETMVYNATGVIGRVHNLEMGCKPFTSACVPNQWSEGAQYVAFKGTLQGRKGYYGVVGFTTFQEYFGSVSLCENGEFFAYANLEEAWVYPNATLKTDECFIYFERKNIDVLSVYGKRIAEKNPLLNDRPLLPTGWCSWYYYGPNISQEKILENMSEIKKYRLPVRYIQIDDGWQKCYGDWEANERFPMGMKALADEIYRAGFIPGIWVTPFGFAENAQVFQEHPDWFIRNDDGKLHPNRLIDYSVKGAQEWLYNLAKKISVDWGYRYIKIDLVSYRLAFAGYKKKGFHALDNFRTMLKIMRSAVTDNTVFLTCTSPIGASAGLAECVRISDDIFEKWDSLKTVAGQVFRRYFLSEYIHTDPDCLMVRKKEQHDEEAFRICTRDEREIRTFVTFMSAAGGAVMLSDKMTLLKGEDIEKIRALFPINLKPAKPLDIFERAIPSVLYYGEEKGVEIYALFNWENTAQTFCLPFAKGQYVKTYYQGVLYEKDTLTSFLLPPHDSEIIYVSKDKELLKGLGKSIMEI